MEATLTNYDWFIRTIAGMREAIRNFKEKDFDPLVIEEFEKTLNKQVKMFHKYFPPELN